MPWALLEEIVCGTTKTILALSIRYVSPSHYWLQQWQYWSPDHLRRARAQAPHFHTGVDQDAALPALPAYFWPSPSGTPSPVPPSAWLSGWRTSPSLPARGPVRSQREAERKRGGRALLQPGHAAARVEMPPRLHICCRFWPGRSQAKQAWAWAWVWGCSLSGSLSAGAHLQQIPPMASSAPRICLLLFAKIESGVGGLKMHTFRGIRPKIIQKKQSLLQC